MSPPRLAESRERAYRPDPGSTDQAYGARATGPGLRPVPGELGEFGLAAHERRQYAAVGVHEEQQSTLGAEQAYERLVHERGRLQRLLCAFAPQTDRRHLPQGVIEPRHQPLQRETIAAAPGLQQLGYFTDVGHEETGGWTAGLCPKVKGCVAGYG